MRDPIADLLQRKSATRELGQAPVPSALASFIESEFAHAHDWLQNMPKLTAVSAQDELETFFRRVVKRLAPTG